MKYTYCSDEVKVGNLVIGGKAPVVIQSMTNTDTLDTRKTCDQVKALCDAGCQMVRITASRLAEAENLDRIKNELHRSGYTCPLVADVHFLPEAALISSQIVEKVRINPGNYTDRNRGKIDFTEEEHREAREKIGERIAPLLESCKKNHTVLRVGVNHGSLSERFLSAYGDTPEGMVASAMEFVGICEALDFYDLVISLKSSRVQSMYEAVHGFVERMHHREHRYPLHLGVTEAGNEREGRLISAIGIGSLLREGIGNTIRVSLTEDPVREIEAARQILSAAERGQQMEESLYLTKEKDLTKSDFEQQFWDIPIAFGNQMLRGEKEGFCIHSEPSLKSEAESLLNDIYQAAGVKFYKAHFVACPSCGRTKYDIQKVFSQVKQRFASYQGLCIAVMGCVVNGPGEMADADYGYIGCGNQLVNLYHKGKLVQGNIPEDEALDALENLIKKTQN